MQAKQNVLLFSVKLIEYFFSAINVVPSNPCVAPSPRIKIYYFLLSPCIEEIISTLKLYNFYQVHYLLKTFPFYQIHYHMENIYTHQYH